MPILLHTKLRFSLIFVQSALMGLCTKIKKSRKKTLCRFGEISARSVLKITFNTENTEVSQRKQLILNFIFSIISLNFFAKPIKGEERRGDKGKRRRGEEETRRRKNFKHLLLSFSPFLLFSFSLFPLRCRRLRRFRRFGVALDVGGEIPRGELCRIAAIAKAYNRVEVFDDFARFLD